MEPSVYSDDFSRAFSGILEKTGVTCYQISGFAHLDQAYLSRLRSGEKTNPSPEAIVKICLAIAKFSEKATIQDFELLFKSVGRSLHVTH